MEKGTYENRKGALLIKEKGNLSNMKKGALITELNGVPLEFE